MKEKKSSNACGLHTQKNVITWVGLMTNHKKIYLYPDSVVCLYTMCITRAIVVATDRPIHTRLNRTGNQNKTNTAILILWIHLLSEYCWKHVLAGWVTAELILETMKLISFWFSDLAQNLEARSPSENLFLFLVIIVRPLYEFCVKLGPN